MKKLILGAMITISVSTVAHAGVRADLVKKGAKAVGVIAVKSDGANYTNVTKAIHRAGQERRVADFDAAFVDIIEPTSQFTAKIKAVKVDTSWKSRNVLAVSINSPLKNTRSQIENLIDTKHQWIYEKEAQFLRAYPDDVVAHITEFNGSLHVNVNLIDASGMTIKRDYAKKVAELVNDLSAIAKQSRAHKLGTSLSERQSTKTIGSK